MENETKYAIQVDVEPTYLEDQSVPSEDRYVFAYTVTIRNHGEQAARLLRRHWIIADANGKERQIEGDGVVGEQPLLDPGKHFRYTSGAVLETPVGSMRGRYQMLAEDGMLFDAEIPVFTLAIPRTLH
ncbi:Co2+/Mg2+ efflux protein ApaG [Alkalilimnicola ehrlichii]|uniref:Protein ApaG n=1 Tax=Alkalilimnicola ehrlichii TaxID=351052 RepID=A0A3E0X2C1_9GAMM|nr:Co2+/Mg2+ efflux protein ApaG [Alkalilimnicola ehrlichii]RFA31270.1 Co2+/Mg2+ efflux protein ApaG [Alkalilimnicola ehrlichii]RFA39637.1 Co2+/Mg2+ efflux protein ApaG [Alkalilimnicola ehrlichii]